MGEEIKNCPFCGADGRLVIDNRQFTVSCSNFRCIASDITPRFTTAESAIRSWNMRGKEIPKELKDKADETN